MAKTKDEVLLDLQSKLTDLSVVLLQAKVKQEEIDKFAFSAHKIVELREQIRWMKQVLEPSVQLFLAQYNCKVKEAWELMHSMNKFHPDFKVLELRAKQIRRAWRTRPKFTKIKKVRHP